MSTLPSLKQNILEKIEKKEIKAHSKLFFISKKILIILIIIIILGFALFLSSFILFALEKSELLYLPGLGWKGLELFIINLPWLLIGLVITFIIFLEFLVNRYDFAYRQPLLYSALFILATITILSIFMDKTTLHDQIYGHVQNGQINFAQPLYNNYTKPNSAEYHPGTVTELTADGFIIEKADRSTQEVIINNQTKIKENLKIEKGKRLLIIGTVNKQKIEAVIIDNAPPTGRP